MNLPLMFFILVIGVVFMSVYSSKKLEKQLFVTIRTAVDRKEETLVDIRGRYFYWRGVKYEIIPSCCKPMTWKRGVHSIIPTTVQTADYTWSSTLPINPDTGEIFVVSPEARGRMDAEETFSAMNKSTKKDFGDKEKPLNKYLPYIIIGVVVIVAVYFFMQIKGLDNSITTLGEFFKAHVNTPAK
jgi:hypothetical protein